MNRFFQPKNRQKILYALLIGAILVGGILARVQAYRQAHSLWIDEACLMLNVLERPAPQLLQPLSDDQGSPVGFLMTVKLLTSALGEDEWVLRLVPFLGSLAALGLFFLLARKLLEKSGLVIAMFLFAFHPGLVRYTAEAKQYSSDVTVTLALSLCGLLFLRGPKKWFQAAGLAALGAAAVWFSHPAIFILAAIGIVWLVDEIRSRHFDYAKMAPVGLTWLLSFTALYFVSLSKLHANNFLVSFWQIGFPPFPIRSWQDLYWYVNLPASLFNYPTDNPYWGLAGFLVVIGIVIWFRLKVREALLILIPILLTLLAAAVHYYPFASRLILFLVPCGILFLAKSVEQTALLFRQGRLAYLAFVLILLGAYPLSQAFDRQLRQDANEELRPVVAYLKKEWQPGDGVYVYYVSTCSFRYYAREYKIPAETYQIGTPVEDVNNNWKSYLANDIQKFADRSRVWFVFSHNRAENLSESLDFLNLNGVQLASYIKPDASIYLYDLSKWNGRDEAP